MQYREFGKTGKKLSVIGFGGMRFKDPDEGICAMMRAYELGINYFDTAPLYCNDKSEIIFGRAIRLMKKRKKELGPFYISTKSGLHNDPTADDTRRRLEKSLSRLGLNKIDFFYMWCLMNLADFARIIAPGGPLEGARKAKQEGLIDHIVFSTHANGADIRKICQSGMFEGILLGYNLINSDYRKEGIRAAAEAGLGVVVMNPLAGGLFSRPFGGLKELPETKNTSIPQTALKFVLSTPGVTVALSGMKNIAEVEENVAAADLAVQPNEEILTKLKERFRNLGENFCNYCQYCMPCPEKIPIPDYMLVSDYLRVGEKDSADLYLRYNTEHFRKDGVSARDCTDCGQCEELCTQKLDITRRLKEINKNYPFKKD